MPQAYAIPPRESFAISQAHFSALTDRLQSDAVLAFDHTEVEQLVEIEGRELLRRLLQDHFALRAEHERAREYDRPVVGVDRIERTHRRATTRALETLFGRVEVERRAFGARDHGALQPLDAALNLPADLYSLGVRRRVAETVARLSFDETVSMLTQQTGASVGKRQAEELTARAAQDFDAFYEARAAEPAGPPTASTSLVVISVDGKGVMMRREHLRAQTRKDVEARSGKLTKRRSKGEKRGTKRMAAVAAVWTVAPWVRRVEHVMGELGGEVLADAPPSVRPRCERKRVWASLAKTAPEVIGKAFVEALSRDPERQQRWVVLVDGAPGLLRWVQREARRIGVRITVVIDVIHAIEYLWKAAWAFFAEGDAAAESWVRERVARLLRGEASGVAAGIRRSATRRKLAPSKRRPVDVCASYLLRRKRNLRYDRYLAEGLPIATGVIEGACRHLIKDRMDLTGARWGLTGAEAVLRLRSLHLSGDLDAYWAFHRRREFDRNHGARYHGPIPRLQLVTPTSDRAASRRRGAHLRLVR